MNFAISLARRGLGRTAPNPSVGCVIVKGGIVVATARTDDGGRPHAETRALQMAGAQARGATLYVTLEPCTHHGQTPPCTDAIIAAGISRVVIGTKDVDPRVDGRSVDVLQKAGIEVSIGVLEQDCAALNVGFFKRILENRPFVTLKMACTLDGNIATASGESQWITGALARRHVHQLRAQHDAILIGIGTAMADDPALSTRMAGVDHRALRIVLDTGLHLSPQSRLVETASEVPLLVVHNCDDDFPKQALLDAGVTLEKCDTHNISAVLSVLSKHGVTRLLVEGGQQVQASFLRAGMCDDLVIYRAPTLLGGDALPMVSDLSVDVLAQRYDFTRYSLQVLDVDVIERYNNLKKEGDV